MGEKNNDGGQFFTPREVIRAMVRAIDPKVGETVYDPGCGTGGFLAQAFEWMRARPGRRTRPRTQLRILREDTFWGREKADLVYPIALANLVLHGIDHPHIWHGNTLTGQEVYGGLFAGRADAVRRRPDEPAVRRQGGQGGPDATSPTRPARRRCSSSSTSSTR